jgi:glycosyltransferase involved in cell wall biosynthesis
VRLFVNGEILTSIDINTSKNHAVQKVRQYEPTLGAKVTRVGIYLGSMSGPGTGAWNWFLALAEELELHRDFQVIVFVDYEKAQLLEPFRGLKVVSTPNRSRIHKLFRLRREIRYLIKEHNLDTLHFFTLPVPSGLNINTVYTLHDLRSNYPRKIGGGTWKDLPRKIALKRMPRKVDFVVTPSQWAKRDIHRILRVSLERIIVVPQILKIPLTVPTTKRVRIETQETYVLALGHIEIRKNLELLVLALQSDFWPKDTALRIVGRDLGQRKNLEKRYQKNPRNELVIQSEVSEEMKWELINSATVIVVPSLIEGYGIVTVEGVLAGVPVLVSDQSALPEVIGVPQAILSAYDSEAWALEIKNLIEDEKRREYLVAKEVDYLKQSQDVKHVIDLLAAYSSPDKQPTINSKKRSENS